MNSINIQSTALVSKQKKYKDFLRQSNLKKDIEDDNINILPIESIKSDENSIDQTLQGKPEDGEGIDLSGSSSIEFLKKEIIKTESPVYTEEKSSFNQKNIDQLLISINPLKKQL